MIASMTGFGRGQAQAGSLTITIELKSVNSRYCEVAARLPRVFAEYEPKLQTLIKDTLSRGRINVSAQLDAAGDTGLSVQVAPDTARGYLDLLQKLKEATGIDEPISLSHLISFPDIFVGLEQVAGQDADLWPALEAATKAALEQLRSMRRQEGQALGRDLLERIDAIANSQAKVETRAPQRIEEARNRLHERIEDLFSDERIDRDRLEFEIAILADKLDITEECVRLTSHLDLFREALKSSEPVGRKLNFLIQEINREVNTIGSKANDAQVAHLAVEMKEELERIREQVQNIE